MKNIKKFLKDPRMEDEDDFTTSFNDDFDTDFVTTPFDDDEEDTKSKPYDIEKKSKEIIGERLQKIRESEKKWAEELEDETDTNFYFQIVCKNPTDMNNFLDKMDITLHHDDFIFVEDFESKVEAYYKKKFSKK